MRWMSHNHLNDHTVLLFMLVYVIILSWIWYCTAVLLVYVIIIMDLVGGRKIVYSYTCMFKFIDILFCYGDESYKEDFPQMGQSNGTVQFVLVSRKL